MALIDAQKMAYNLGMTALDELIRQQKILLVSSFDYNDTRFSFRVPYRLDFKYDDKYFYHENDELEIYIREENLENLVTEFYDSICSLWMGYAVRDDAELSSGAQELKQVLRNLIEVTK